MPETDYQVQLDNVFEGPMDLLVYLIRKNEVDIYDIPIATITDQYLAYIDMMKQLNIDLAGDFILMASTLTHIKSRMMLPARPGDDDGEEEDPRLEITRPLLEYLQLKSVAEQLEERSILGQDTFVRYPATAEFRSGSEDDTIQVGLFELIDAFQKILENVSVEHRVDLTADRISIKDRIAEIVEVLEKEGSITFDGLFPGTATKSDIIVTFLAILEMARLHLVRIAQHVQTGIIRLFYQ